LEWEGEVVAEEPPIDVEAMGEGPEQLEES
jgi:hypothetical protein